MSSSAISILLVGRTSRSEFREACSVLPAAGRVTGVREVRSAVVALTQGHVAADVIVVAQSVPGQFSHQAIDRLRQLAPLACLVGLMGSWCEGEVRTGRPWPGTVRVYWHQWLPRWQQELGRLRRGECSGWGLPITATDEERLLLAADQPVPPARGLIAICTRSVEMHNWLSAALRCCGCSTVWLRPPRPAPVAGAAAAVLDGADGRADELRQLEHLAAAVGSAPILALLDFPRTQDHDRLRAAGAAAVVSKPVQLNDLFWHVDQLLKGKPDSK